MTMQPTLSTVLDGKLKAWKPSEIVFASVGGCIAVHLAYNLLASGEVLQRADKAKWRVIRRVLSSFVQKKINEAAAEIKFPVKAGAPIFEELPKEGMSPERVLALCNDLKGLDHGFEKGELSGCIYHGGAEHTKFVNDVMSLYQWSNPLHVDVHGAVRKMEAEIISMCVRLFRGGSLPDACGALTSGGTESIGMAIKTYREWGRARRCITQPNIVAPITCHPAFDKAANYYGVELIKVPIDPATRKVDPAILAKYITSNTVAIVGSAPSFPYGVVDPIPELGALALAHGIGLHVDCCLGGFIVPFMHAAGFTDAPIVDFRVPGVTTISADTHKYGFSPKGTSVVLYASKELRRYQFFTTAEWPGGMYCSPGAAGSRPGNIIAGCWATMLSIGEAGYVDSCRRIVTAARAMANGVAAVPGLRLLAKPDASAFAFTADTVDVYLMSDKLKARGWMLSPLQFPSGLQFSVTLLHTRPGVTARFVQDVTEVVKELVAEHGESKQSGEGGATLYGSQQRVKDRTIIEDVMKVYLDSYHSTRPKAPAKK